jgi:HipA-like protein
MNDHDDRDTPGLDVYLREQKIGRLSLDEKRRFMFQYDAGWIRQKGAVPLSLHRIEIHFSVLQRKALMPNDFKSLEQLQERILGFQLYYEQIAKPFEWKFTRNDLNIFLNKIKLAQSTSERLDA